MCSTPKRHVDSVKLGTFLGDFISLVNPGKKCDYDKNVFGALAKAGKNVRYIRKQALVNSAYGEVGDKIVGSYLHNLSDQLSSQPFYLVKVGNQQVAYILDGLKRLSWLCRAFGDPEKYKARIFANSELSLKVVTLHFNSIEDALSYYVGNEYLFRDDSGKQTLVRKMHQDLSDARNGIERVDENSIELPKIVDRQKLQTFKDKLAIVINNLNGVSVQGGDILFKEEKPEWDDLISISDSEKAIGLYLNKKRIYQFTDWLEVCHLYTLITGESLNRGCEVTSLGNISTYVRCLKFNK